MAQTTQIASRRPGALCCTAPPPGALEFEAAQALGRDLELLAHPVRLRLLSVLARSPEPICVCDLEVLVPVKQPTVSHHLRILKESGLITSERHGLWTYYSVRAEAARALRERIREGLGRLSPRGAGSSTAGG